MKHITEIILRLFYFYFLSSQKFGVSEKIFESLIPLNQGENQRYISNGKESLNFLKTITNNNTEKLDSKNIQYNVNINIWMPGDNNSSTISSTAITDSMDQIKNWTSGNPILYYLLRNFGGSPMVKDQPKTNGINSITRNQLVGYSVPGVESSYRLLPNYKDEYFIKFINDDKFSNDATKLNKDDAKFSKYGTKSIDDTTFNNDELKKFPYTKDISKVSSSLEKLMMMGNLNKLMKYVKRKQYDNSKKKNDKKSKINSIINEENNKNLKEKFSEISRRKRSTPKNESSEAKLPTARIVNRENVYPKSFNFNNLITDILLDRYPDQGPWIKPSRFNSNRYASNPGFIRPHMTEIDHNINRVPVSTPSSFDDLSLGSDFISDDENLNIEKRLGKLDSIFKSLNIDTEECRRRIMCEVARDAHALSPLAEVLQHETKFGRSIRKGGRNLLNSKAGVRLLSYIDASSRGHDEYRQCDIYKYHCRSTVKDIIDMDALMVWREVVGWLTVKVLAKDR